MERLDNKMAHNWHVAINRFHEGRSNESWQHWMYEAKDVADEVPRLILLFGKERRGELSKTHQQCSYSKPEVIPANVLTCCLGVECRKCEFLLALENPALSPEQIDTAKAWTCATHIVTKGGDVAREGYVLTTGDRMYWDNVYASLMANDEAPDDEPDTTATA